MQNVLVLIDIQVEYVCENRPFYLKGIEPSLENCLSLLSFARKKKWKIIHIQHTNGDKSERFKLGSKYFDFVDAFKPHDGEYHFVKKDFSCYDNKNFDELMVLSNKNGDNVYLIGYNTVMCCLSTLEEARRRQHKMYLVTDATYAKATGNFNEMETHEFMLALYRQKGLANLVKTSDIVGAY